MMTIPAYLQSPARRGSGLVTQLAADDRGEYVLLDATLFHPQGGGQPADTGLVEGVAVSHVSAQDGQIRHYLSSPPGFEPGQMVSLSVDEARRSMNERLHTAGHLLACVAELLFPQLEALGGHHWPGEARVEFARGSDVIDVDSMRFILEPELRRALARKSTVYASEAPGGARLVVIDGYRGIPCGGTHVACLGDVGEVIIREIKARQQTLRIGYDICNSPD